MFVSEKGVLITSESNFFRLKDIRKVTLVEAKIRKKYFIECKVVTEQTQYSERFEVTSHYDFDSGSQYLFHPTIDNTLSVNAELRKTLTACYHRTGHRIVELHKEYKVVFFSEKEELGTHVITDVYTCGILEATAKACMRKHDIQQEILTLFVNSEESSECTIK